MFGIGSFELLVILAVALIILGPKRLPELTRTLGKWFATLKREVDDLKDSIDVISRSEESSDKSARLPSTKPTDSGTSN